MTDNTSGGRVELNRVYCMDALSLMAQVEDDSIDMALTSPPYDNLRTYDGHSEFDFETIARETYRVLKLGGVLVWVVGDATINGSETLTSMRQALYFVDVVGFKMHDTMIWCKNGTPGSNGKRYRAGFEYMFILCKGQIGTFNPQLREAIKANSRFYKSAGSAEYGWKGQGKSDSFVKPFVMYDNYWYIPVGFGHTTEGAASHVAAFPEKLAERHILTWSNPGDVVMDYFMGSGTTAKMARNNGRDYIGCDINAEYVALANRRLAKPYTLSMFEEKPTEDKPVQAVMEL